MTPSAAHAESVDGLGARTRSCAPLGRIHRYPPAHGSAASPVPTRTVSSDVPGSFSEDGVDVTGTPTSFGHPGTASPVARSSAYTSPERSPNTAAGPPSSVAGAGDDSATSWVPSGIVTRQTSRRTGADAWVRAVWARGAWACAAGAVAAAWGRPTRAPASTAAPPATASAATRLTPPRRSDPALIRFPPLASPRGRLRASLAHGPARGSRYPWWDDRRSGHPAGAPHAGDLRATEGRARGPDDARPGGDRPGHRVRTRAGRPLRERRLPRRQGRPGEDGVADPPAPGLLKDAQIVEAGAASDGTVTQGAVVTLRYEGDEETQDFFVGSIEERRGDMPVISPSAPLGQALMGRSAGDTVAYDAPGGTLTVEIVRVGA